MRQIAGVILAGGKAERLGGVNKALVEIGGERLIDRALAALSDCEPVIVARGLRPIEGIEAPQVPDLDARYGGPLAGVAAAVAALVEARPAFVATLAVDTPFAPRDFIDRALALDAPAVVAAYDGQRYPTNALWRFGAIATLPRRIEIATAPHSLKRLLAEVGAVPLDYLGRVPFDPFASINTPEELAAARRRAAS